MQHSFNLDVQFSCDGFVVVSNYINIETVCSKIFEKNAHSIQVRECSFFGDAKNKHNACYNFLKRLKLKHSG